uniref:C2H2-type domain-containing protein n=1 Tax=Ditylenchus dipsaci TaxID=166011 RepID=A0A915DP13_9BILA
MIRSIMLIIKSVYHINASGIVLKLAHNEGRKSDVEVGAETLHICAFIYFFAMLPLETFTELSYFVPLKQCMQLLVLSVRTCPTFVHRCTLQLIALTPKEIEQKLGKIGELTNNQGAIDETRGRCISTIREFLTVQIKKCLNDYPFLKLSELEALEGLAAEAEKFEQLMGQLKYNHLEEVLDCHRLQVEIFIKTEIAKLDDFLLSLKQQQLLDEQQQHLLGKQLLEEQQHHLLDKLRNTPKCKGVVFPGSEFQKKCQEEYLAVIATIQKEEGVTIVYDYPSSSNPVVVVIKGHQEARMDAAVTRLKDFMKSESPAKSSHSISNILGVASTTMMHHDVGGEDQNEQQSVETGNPSQPMPQMSSIQVAPTPHPQKPSTNVEKTGFQCLECKAKLKTSWGILKHYNTSHIGIQCPYKDD